MTREEIIDKDNDLEQVLEVVSIIKRRRKQLGISQELLAETIGMDRAYYTRVEQGKKPGISLWYTIRLLNALNMKIEIGANT